MLHILHTNDIHGHLSNWPVIKNYFQREIAYYEANNEPYLLIDVGDALDTVHPLVEATQGQIMIDLFNEVGYDIATIGNNEGLNFTSKQLTKLYEKANYDVVISNLLDDLTHEPPKWGEAILFKTINEYKIAFIGLTAPYPTYNLNNYEIINPIDALQEQLDNIENNEPDTDLVILLSHLGIESDRYIANLFPNINLILGAHTHHVLVEGEWINQTLLAAAGKHGNFVGDISIHYDTKYGDFNYEARAHTIEQLKERLNWSTRRDEFESEGRQLLAQKPVADVPHYYSALELSGEHSFIQMALKALTWYTDTQISILNSGLFLRDLSSGVVTENELHEALPHPMHLAVLTMEGSDLVDMLYEMEEQREDLKYKMISGLGFRGKLFGELVYRGIHYNEIQREWQFRNQTIEPTRIYHVVTVDHLWFLPYFPTMDELGNVQLIFPDFIRHVVGKYLSTNYPLNDDMN